MFDSAAGRRRRSPSPLILLFCPSIGETAKSLLSSSAPAMMPLSSSSRSCAGVTRLGPELSRRSCLDTLTVSMVSWRRRIMKSRKIKRKRDIGPSCPTKSMIIPPCRYPPVASEPEAGSEKR